MNRTVLLFKGWISKVIDRYVFDLGKILHFLIIKVTLQVYQQDTNKVQNRLAVWAYPVKSNRPLGKLQ